MSCLDFLDLVYLSKCQDVGFTYDKNTTGSTCYSYITSGYVGKEQIRRFMQENYFTYPFAFITATFTTIIPDLLLQLNK